MVEPKEGNMLTWLDLYLYDRVFSPLATWLHKRYGFSNFGLAKWFFVVGNTLVLLAFGVLVVTSVPGDEMAHFYTMGIMLLIEAFFGYRGLRKTLTREADFERQRDSNKLPHNLRDGQYSEVNLRRLFLFVVVFVGSLTVIQALNGNTHGFGTVNLVRLSGAIFILVAFYFLSVPPRLPRKREQTVSIGKTVPVQA